MQKITKINTELKDKFNHEEISSNYHFGTEKGDNYFEVSFYEYDMNSKSYNQLESTADSVFNYFKKYKEDFENLEFTEVRFTKEKNDDAESFVSFKSNY